MRVADRRHSRLQPKKKRRLPRWLKWSLFSLGAFTVLFVLVNLGMALLYKGKVLPNYSVAGIAIGNTSFDSLGRKVSVENILPAKVVLKKDDKKQELAPKDLGVAVDLDATRENIRQSRSWVPVMSFIFKNNVPAELKLDNTKFAEAAQNLETTFRKDSLPQRIVFEENDFTLADPETGYELDAVKLRSELVGALEQGKAELAVPTTGLEPEEGSGADLQKELARLRKYLDAKITLINGSGKQQLSRADIAGFFEPDGQTLKLSDAKISDTVDKVSSELKANAVNKSEAVTAAKYALRKSQPVEFVLAGQGAKVYRYCVAARGLDNSVLGDYRLKLAAVYADPRGWNNGGEVAFVYAESDCDYTAWLSAAAEVTSFSAVVCDNFYSCRVGTNVIVNYDRWKGATPSWNDAGGKLEGYRAMVINHETGHWLGYGHRNCTGEGDPAPVMQQQSIDLQGCKFNAWPTKAELASL